MPPVSTSRRKATAFRSSQPSRRPGHGKSRRPGADKEEHEILFQTYFKSVGPRTYAAQVKKATNDNHYLVLTEGKRDEKTGEVRKARLFVYSEDFIPFFRMLQETAQFIRANPLPEEVKRRRDQYWQRKGRETSPDSRSNAGAPGAMPASPPASPQSRAPGHQPPRPAASAARVAAPGSKPASDTRPAGTASPQRRPEPQVVR